MKNFKIILFVLLFFNSKKLFTATKQEKSARAAELSRVGSDVSKDVVKK